MNQMKPPYAITREILNLVAQVSEMLGEINAASLVKQVPQLRKQNRIKTIQSSLEIEGNTLSAAQVTALFENKRVLGPQKDIIEVQNAIAAYNQSGSFKSTSLSSFLKAHKVLLNKLIPGAGRFRSTNVGIKKGGTIAHIAPDGSIVKGLMKDLFDYLKKDKDPLLIKSCVFHYELEFIHPFADGNGRMGRLWQSIILGEKYPVFTFLPVESVIKERQNEYYKVLNICDMAGSSTAFIEFMLTIIRDELVNISKIIPRKSLTNDDRMEIARSAFGTGAFARKDYLLKFKSISAPTASRDLKHAVDKKLLIKSGDKRKTSYRFRK